MSVCAHHQLLKRLAGLQLESGDAAGASASYEAAVEAALAAGKMKLYQKLSALAAEHAPEEEAGE